MKRELSNAARVAKIIRHYMKANNIPGSVTSENYSMGNSVNVRMTDQTPDTLAKLKTFSDRYQQGQFDSMTDCYELVTATLTAPNIATAEIIAETVLSAPPVPYPVVPGLGQPTTVVADIIISA